MDSRQIIDSPTMVVDQAEDSSHLGFSSEGLQGISIVVPTLNECDNIGELLLRLDSAMVEARMLYEAIVIDDRSQDNTCDVARSVAQDKHLPVRVFTKQGQRGKAFSLLEGFAQAQYDVLALLDGDLQYPPDAIPKMVEKLKSADIVIGDRRVAYGGVDRFRGALSSIFTGVVNLLFGLDTDVQSE